MWKHRGKKYLPIRDLVDRFSNRITKYSQIDGIIKHLKTTPLDVRSELGYMRKRFDLSR